MSLYSQVKESIFCCLCRVEIPSGGGSPLKKKIGSSQFSYLEVITKLFQKERLQSYLDQADFSNENLCVECGHLLDDLFRLQYELRLKKNKIVGIFKSSKIRAEKDKTKDVNNKENFPHEDTRDSSKDPNDVVKSSEDKDKNYAPREKVTVTMEVEDILDKRGRGKMVEYFVKWKDFNKPSDNTWELASNLGKSVIEDFEKKMLKKQNSSNDKKRTSVENAQTKPEKKNKAKKAQSEEYIIESLVKKEGNKYLVKWENFPVAQSTWEPRSSIPKFILEVNSLSFIFPDC